MQTNFKSPGSDSDANNQPEDKNQQGTPGQKPVDKGQNSSHKHPIFTKQHDKGQQTTGHRPVEQARNTVANSAKPATKTPAVDASKIAKNLPTTQDNMESLTPANLKAANSVVYQKGKFGVQSPNGSNYTGR